MIRHPAIVRDWANGQATVEVIHEPDEGCAACLARASCSLATGSQGKPTRLAQVDWAVPLSSGQEIFVVLRANSEWKAILLAFFLPFASLGTGLGIGFALQLSGSVSALLSLACLFLYGMGLYLFRARLARTFAMTVEMPGEEGS